MCSRRGFRPRRTCAHTHGSMDRDVGGAQIPVRSGMGRSLDGQGSRVGRLESRWINRAGVVIADAATGRACPRLARPGTCAEARSSVATADAATGRACSRVARPGTCEEARVQRGDGRMQRSSGSSPGRRVW